VTVETFTSDIATPGTPVWDAPRHKTGAAISFTQLVPEQLVQSPRGRFLWVRVTLSTSDGHNTPSVSAIRAWYPRVSYLDLLPAAYRRAPEAAIFLDHFLALFEHVFTGIEDRYVAFSSELDCESAPREVIDWLGALVDLAFDPSWPLEKRQALVCEAISLYRTRGTIPGIERYVEIYIGNRPQIVEDWLERPSRPAFLGMPGAVLGWGLPILPVVGGAMPSDAVLWALYAHRFTIFVYIDDDGQTEMTLRAVDRIVEVNKPAHTVHRSEPIFANARVGIQSRVGLDLVLGAPPAMSVQLGGCEPNSAGINEPGGVLGRNTLLGSARAGYVQPLGAPGTGAQ
jgi:phage tail-like protein